MGTIRQTWNSLPGWGKMLILAGGGYGIYRAGKFVIQGAGGSKESNSELNVDAVKTEADQILMNNAVLPPDQRTLATYQPSQYKTYAQTLFTAMDGAGTDWDPIKNVFDDMKNDLDILYLIDAFGTRKGTSWFASSDETDLASWLADDGVTEDVNGILETKARITKRF